MLYTKPRITNVTEAMSAIQGVKDINTPTDNMPPQHTTSPAFPADE